LADQNYLTIFWASTAMSKAMEKLGQAVGLGLLLVSCPIAFS
jgi:hypothetical protein